MHLPIGILPLGRTNNVAQKLLQPQDENFVHFLTNATLAIIQEVNTSHPVVKIENLEVSITLNYSLFFFFSYSLFYHKLS